MPPKVKVPIDWRPNYLKFSYDAVPVARSIAKNGQNSQEVQVLFNVDKFFLALEGGNQNFTRKNSFETDSTFWDYTYTNKGHFFRFGPDINLIKNNKNGGTLTFGARYGRSVFQDRLVLTDQDQIGFDPINYSDENDKITSQWMELISGLNVALTRNLHMGFTVRYKIQRGDKNIGTMKPYDIPGFGRYANFNTVGFNYYFGWAIPLREMEAAPPVN